MPIRYDPVKARRNLRERGISFDRAEQFDWTEAYGREDLRKDYSEKRFQALGFIGARLHMLVFTNRGEDVHVISLRKANEREIRQYEEAIRHEETEL